MKYAEKKEKTSSETRAVEIFALRFPLSNSVYVGRSTCRKHWDLYDYYYKGRNITTKKAVEQHITKGVYPQLFILDTVEKTKIKVDYMVVFHVSTFILQLHSLVVFIFAFMILHA